MYWKERSVSRGRHSAVTSSQLTSQLFVSGDLSTLSICTCCEACVNPLPAVTVTSAAALPLAVPFVVDPVGRVEDRFEAL